MIFQRLGLVNKKQGGFTLIELMLAIALSGIITGAITATIFQLVDGSARTNNHMIAVRQAQEAGFFVSRDAQMIQEEPVIERNVDDELESITLTWTDWGGTVNVVIYTFEGTGEVRELWRDDGDGKVIIAQFINPDLDKTDCNFEDGRLTFMVTTTVGAGSQEQSETRTYEVVPRPGSA